MGNLPVAEAGQQSGSPFGPILPFILIVAVFYFLILRPQQKQKKEHQRMLESLKINDRVMTSSGMIGKICNIKADKNTVVIRVDDTTNAKIEFRKSSITAVLTKEEDNGETS